MLENYITYFTIIVNAVFTGAGVAIGTWVSNKVVISHLEKIEKKLNKKRGGFKNGAIRKEK
jgi:uncharacterized protein YneF (UPF0154 family)